LDFPELIPAEYIRRDNRFRATVFVDGSEAWAHVPNSGRLTELFTPGRRVWLSRAENPNRKTAFDLRLVEYADQLVSVDARLPNHLFEEYLSSQTSDVSKDIRSLKREVWFGDSRLDFRLEDEEGIWWVETKSVTLVENGLASFPDAPTARGRRHLLELGEAAQKGVRAAVVFVVQRSDAVHFMPHVEADPEFAKILKQVSKLGVQVLAYICQVSFMKIYISGAIPCKL